MKIYFAGSIRAGNEDRDVYIKLIEHLKKYGEVLTEHIIINETSGKDDLPDEHIFVRDLEWLKQADVIIAEVSIPSLGVGYELGKAEELGKTTLCLHRPHTKRLSAMITGNKNFVIKQYTEINHALEHINHFFCNLSPRQQG